MRNTEAVRKQVDESRETGKREKLKTPKARGVGGETWGSCGEMNHSKLSEVLIISENVVTTLTHLPLCYWY